MLSKDDHDGILSNSIHSHRAASMTSDRDDLWYRIGFALERLRSASERLPGIEGHEADRDAPRRRGRSRAAEGRGPDASASNPAGGQASGDDGADLLQALLSAGTRSAAGRLLSLLPGQRRASLLDLLAAGACGSAAAILVEVGRPLFRSGVPFRLDGPDVASSVLAGAGKGLAYGGVVEPRVPGPAFLLGFLYGSAEYAAASHGGIQALLGRASPHRRLPIPSHLLESPEDDETGYLEHVAFGIALALLYDSVRKRGTVEEEE